MASAPQLPMFYKELVPINLEEHGDWHSRTTDKATWLVNQHAVPLTVEEFPQAQRHFPIVFTAGENPVPLALMGMNEGVNVFVSDDGTVTDGLYLPAYARRYPFMLARLAPDSDELSLCLDPTSDLVGKFDEGAPIFDGESASETTQNTLKFCEQFELAGTKTANFVAELKKHDLLMGGELTVQRDDGKKPMVYRGFQMVDEKKLREVRGDVLRGWSQSGLLPLVYAHIFSLEMVREILRRQVEQGKVPEPEALEAN